MMYRAWMMPGMSERGVLATEWLGGSLMVPGGELTTEDGQENVDEEVGAAATLEEDSERGNEDGEDDLEDVAGVR
jgi:hypothetical protein